ncbi:unnamed protein product [Arctia plantaginis]|uniref:Iron-binding zinc finger CDGSH type domain-containing protein n=1 Tax=Arctia plantaginis TaxID=874455 RepID=A0A8S1BPI7_ARCPL|nr:unnamed protein product [Arctia plantaginis]
MFVRSYLSKVAKNVVSSANYATKISKPEIPKNPLLNLEAGKTYHWCLCGRSKSQPLCDGTHKDIYLKVTQRPVRFTVEKSKEYWLCNCKQTKNRPFCDGTHKQKEIQEAGTVRL